MSTPTDGTPHDPRDGGGTGSQHSAPDFGGGQQHQPDGRHSAGGSSSHSAPSFGAPSSQGPQQHQGPQQGQGAQQGQGSTGTPQYRPAGGGMPQYSPAGGTPGSGQQGPGQYGSSQYGGAQQGRGGRKGKGRPPLWVGLVSLGLGVLLGIIAIIVFFASIVGGANSIAETPSGSTRTLEEDTQYFVFGDSTDSVDSCTVYTPDFESMQLESESVEQSAETDGQTFTLLGTFETDEAGEYRVSCSPYVSEDSMYITDVGVGGMVGGAIAGIVLGLLGGLLFIVGIILIIVNRVSASKNRG